MPEGKKTEKRVTIVENSNNNNNNTEVKDEPAPPAKVKIDLKTSRIKDEQASSSGGEQQLPKLPVPTFKV